MAKFLEWNGGTEENSAISSYLTYKYTRSLGHSAPLLLAPAEGWEALGAPMVLCTILGAFHSRRYQNKHAQFSV